MDADWGQQLSHVVRAPTWSGSCRSDSGWTQQEQLGSGCQEQLCFQAVQACKCPLPSGDHSKKRRDQMESCQDPGGIYWLLSSHGKSEGWKSNECLKNSQVPGSKTQMIFFSTQNCPPVMEKESPSISCQGTLKLCDLPVVASQREKLEWGCPGQSCSGLSLIFSSCFFSSDLCKPAVITQCMKVTQSRGAVTTMNGLSQLKGQRGSDRMSFIAIISGSWNGLGWGTLKITYFQPPCHEQKPQHLCVVFLWILILKIWPFLFLDVSLDR